VRILLIGGNGFIGHFTAKLLTQSGHTVALFHRASNPPAAGLQEIRGDRNQLGASREQLNRFSPDVVVDFVISSGQQAEQLVSFFHGRAARVVMLSSIDVYRAISISQGIEDAPLQQVPLTEDSELRRVLHPYPPETLQVMRKIFSWATDDYDKIPAERVIMSNPQLPGTVLRLPMVYGPGDPLHRFYPIIKRVLDRRPHIIFPQKLAAWRSPRGYVENVAAAIALAATDERAAGRIYNVCEEPAFSELEWAQKITDAMDWEGSFLVLPEEQTPRHLLRPGNADQHWAATSARIRNELEYADPIPLNDAIRRTIAWERENPPTIAAFAQFDYPAEDAAAAAHSGFTNNRAV
jgi:nucleoside-diphosphate-sugar epimerase